MALTTLIHTDELGRVATAAFLGKTFTMALLNHTSAPASTDGICKWLAGEVAGFGYARAQRTLSAIGAYDSGTDARWELPDQDFTFSATGGTLGYTHAVILADAAAGSVIGTIDGATAVDPATDLITVANHSIASGTRVTVRAEVGATLPTGLAAGNTYFLQSQSSSTFKLSTDAGGASVVDITAAGSGNFSVINCAGTIHSIWSESPSRSILTGASYTYRWSPFVND